MSNIKRCVVFYLSLQQSVMSAHFLNRQNQTRTMIKIFLSSILMTLLCGMISVQEKLWYCTSTTSSEEFIKKDVCVTFTKTAF